MIKNSYSASCYIENINGQYDISCDLQTDDDYFEANYSGDSLVEGLNSIMDEIENKATRQNPEDYISALEQKITALEAENKTLKIRSCDCKENKEKIHPWTDEDTKKYFNSLNKLMKELYL